MEYTNVITGYLLVISLIFFLLMFIITNDIFEKQLIKRLTALIIANMVLSVIDILLFGMEEHISNYSNLEIVIYYFLKIALHTSIPVPFAMFLRVYKNEKGAGKLTYYLPLIGLLAIELINTFAPILYKITADGCTNYPSCYLFFLVCIFYSIYFFVYAFRHTEDRKSKRKSLLIISIEAVALAGIVIEYFIRSRFYVELGYTISFCAYYIYLLTHFFRLDSLTKLLNRPAFYHNINDLSGKRFTLVSIDMDNLKEVNDTQGHLEGNRCLVSIAKALEECLPKKVSIYRAGGDEFYALCPNYNEKQTVDVMENVVKNLKEDDIAISYGIVENVKEKSVDELIREADIKVYVMKSIHKMGK